MNIGERIKARRIELNLTQDELAKRCGYKSRSSINKIELARALPLKKVSLMATALDVTPSYLMGWDDEPISMETPEERNKESTEELFERLVESYARGFIIQKYDKLPNDYKLQVDMLIETYYQLGIDTGRIEE